MNLCFVFGTRPEAIKMIPIIKEAEKTEGVNVINIISGQHREMLDPILENFEINVDYDLNIMHEGQTLTSITERIITGLDEIFNNVDIDVVLVHGDTTTALASAISAFYHQLPIGHVEAGLITNDIYSPYPEEANRQIIDILTDYYFCPTEVSKDNLLREGKSEDKIFVVGNSSIDMLKHTLEKEYNHELIAGLEDKRIILLTTHRRENLGENMQNIFEAVNEICKRYEDIVFIFPIHKNPKIRELAPNILDNDKQIRIIEPLDVIDFHHIINKSELILTDSGGIQEEAPHLGRPVLVLRDATERPEGVRAGCLKLVGTNKEDILNNVINLLDNKEEYNKMSNASNPYGDGTTSKQIVQILIEGINE